MSAYLTCIRHPVTWGGGSRRNIVMQFGTKKTRMVWLPDGKQNLKICLFVLTECTNVKDTHTHCMTEYAALA